MNETMTVEVWVAANDACDYAVATSEDDLKGCYENQVGEWAGNAIRVLRLLVTIPVPKPVELTATVSDEPATGELKVA
jgi:hypothetical protein